MDALSRAFGRYMAPLNACIRCSVLSPTHTNLVTICYEGLAQSVVTCEHICHKPLKHSILNDSRPLKPTTQKWLRSLTPTIFGSVSNTQGTWIPDRPCDSVASLRQQ